MATKQTYSVGADVLGDLYTPRVPVKINPTLLSQFGTSASPGAVDGSSVFGSNTLGTGANKYAFGIDPELSAFGDANLKVPELGGGWTSKAGMALNFVNAGVGVANAMSNIRQNKFMRGYYGDQMNLQKADFGNAARSTNAELAARQERILGAQGLATGSAENKAAVADYMKQWGAKEKY